MAEFLGDIAFMFEVFILGVGLVVLHWGRKESSGLLKVSGTLMSGAAILGLICTTYFYFKYWSNGEFDSAYPNTRVVSQSEK